jgi:hypothetical protein
MSNFYRYLRPLKYDFKRFQIDTSPRGGICFYIRDDGNRLITLSYSICHEFDVFDKAVARTIAMQRFNHGVTIQIETESVHTDDIQAALIKLDEADRKETSTKGFYQRKELRLLTDKIKKINTNHRYTNELLYVSQDTIQSLHLKKSYEELQYR